MDSLLRYRLFHTDPAADIPTMLASAGTLDDAHACAEALSHGRRVAVANCTNKEAAGEVLAVYQDGRCYFPR